MFVAYLGGIIPTLLYAFYAFATESAAAIFNVAFMIMYLPFVLPYTFGASVAVAYLISKGWIRSEP
jgi:multisubunit Na+/H+ antiporter MnhE subunit